MNIQIGDKIKIRDNYNFCDEAKNDICQLSDRIGTVVEVNRSKTSGIFLTCKIEGMDWQFCEKHIEYVVGEENEQTVSEEIDRFELIDFD